MSEDTKRDPEESILLNYFLSIEYCPKSYILLLRELKSSLFEVWIHVQFQRGESPQFGINSPNLSSDEILIEWITVFSHSSLSSFLYLIPNVVKWIPLSRMAIILIDDGRSPVKNQSCSVKGYWIRLSRCRYTCQGVGTRRDRNRP